LDLRLVKPRSYRVDFQLTGQLTAPAGLDFAPLTLHPAPQVEFSGVAVPYHLSRELLSYFPKATGPGSFVLDLGCGKTIHKGVCEHAGFQYVGMDYDSPEAPLLGDAHALPFRGEAFDFVLSIAVLEHLRFPFVAMQEVLRVLKPGGLFIGTVAFLEPFHLDSYYHHSHLGTLNSLMSAGFTPEVIAASDSWSVLTAQAQMALFPGMPRRLARAAIRPVVIFHKLWWRLRQVLTFRRDFQRYRSDDLLRIRNTSGAFYFVVRKA
jgi:SAM-dependent methyltransferase